jgi:uncharacterized protein (DUF2336 family)
MNAGLSRRIYPHKRMQKEELVKSLRELEVHPSSQNRKKLALDLCDICLAPDESSSGAESAMFFDILFTLIRDVELDVRARLAERIAERDDVPHDLITFLASDEIAVAYPILVFSELLDDDDLVLLINEKAREHQLAVTKRYWLSPDVSEALVKTGDSTVVVSLLRNDGAEIYPETAERLVGACRDSIEYREPLACRDDLSSELAAKLYVWVGDVLCDQIVGRFEFEPGVIDDAIANVLSESVAQLARNANIENPAGERTDTMQGSRASGLLLNYLQSGVVQRFEQHFGSLTALPISAVRRALYKLGAEGLAVACKGAGIELDIFAELYWRIHGSGAFALFWASEKYKRAMEYFASIDPVGARELLNVWRIAPPEPG